jgi:hypothetical protein
MIDPGQGERSAGGESPSDLAIAIERARSLVVPTEVVDRLTADVLRKTAKANDISQYAGKRGIGVLPVYWLCAVAASIGSIIMIRDWMTISEEHGEPPVMELVTEPRYSPITSVAYLPVGYRQIEVDLDLADKLVETVSEGLALASVRHEIQVTLDEFYDWSK